MAEGITHEFSLGFTKPVVSNPYERPAMELKICEASVLEAQIKEISELDSQFAHEANRRGVAALAWRNLVRRTPTILFDFGEGTVRMMLARSFPTHDNVEIAHIGFYPDGQPGNVSFEAVATRSPRPHVSPDFFIDELRNSQLEPRHEDYKADTDWFFTMIDMYQNLIRINDLDHVEKDIFRVPLNRYDLSRGELQRLLAVQETGDPTDPGSGGNFLWLPQY